MLGYSRGRVRGELALSGAVAIHDTLSLSRADTSAVAFVAARGETTVLRRLIVGAELTNGLALFGLGDERFTHLLELSVGTQWRRSRAGVGVYVPIDTSYRNAGIWGVVCSVEVSR